MIDLLKKHNKLNETLFMGTITVFCFSFAIFRYIYTGSITFWFLNWNLFLAFIPWVLSTLATIRPNLQKNKIVFVFLLMIWLLFFPNSPYILTDLFHVNSKNSMPTWFDLLLVLSYAWTGLLYGFLSLWDIERMLKKSINKAYTIIISIMLLFLGSFGVYLGRYLRWNSWDIISEPFGILYDIGDRLVNPFQHTRTWGMTIFMGIFLNMIYWSFKLIRKRNE